jgi:NTP pyrophosphatase (non-canonical NTP hydrolase)
MTMRDLFDDFDADNDTFEDWDTFPMTFEDYAVSAMQTAIYPGALVYPVLGLVGEAGEVAEKLKKYFRDGEHDDTALEEPMIEMRSRMRHEIAKELGDVLWYVTAVANDIGYQLEEIAELNLEKLQDRDRRDQLRGNGDNR